MFKKKSVSNNSPKESKDNSLNDLTEEEQEILSGTLHSIMKKETALIHSILQSKLNEVEKKGGHQNGTDE